MPWCPRPLFSCKVRDLHSRRPEAGRERSCPPRVRSGGRAAARVAPALTWLLCGVLVVAGSVACITVPPDIREDFAAPDGTRPNNYGRTVEIPEGKIVTPDRPTFPGHAIDGETGADATGNDR